MAQTLTFSLVSPERLVMQEEVESVVAPGSEGFFEVYPNHAPFLTTIAPGVLEVKKAGSKERIFVRGGFAEVTPEGLNILAEVAVKADEYDSATLSAAVAEIQTELSEAANDDDRWTAQRALDALKSLSA